MNALERVWRAVTVSFHAGSSETLNLTGARREQLSTAGRAVPSPSRGGAGYEGVIGELDAFVKTAGMYTHRR